MGRKVDLFLDSGAYTAWTQGKKIDLDRYIRFIKAHEQDFSLYAVLDVIGSAEGTLRNQEYMEAAGLRPIPTFHFGEDFSYLRRYVDGYDYIAIGGLAAMGMCSDMISFLNQAFDIICDSDGVPKVKVHGFAVTSIRAMIRWPWYSVDSSSWLMTSRLGSIFVPHKTQSGEWDYLETTGKPSRKVGLTGITSSTGVSDGHLSNISQEWKADTLQWIAEHGFTLGKSTYKEVPSSYVLMENERWCCEPLTSMSDTFGGHKKRATKWDRRWVEVMEEYGATNCSVARDIMNARYFLEVEKRLPAWPWAWQRPALRRLF